MRFGLHFLLEGEIKLNLQNWFSQIHLVDKFVKKRWWREISHIFIEMIPPIVPKKTILFYSYLS